MVRAEDYKNKTTLTLIPTSSLASGPLIQYNFNEAAGLKILFHLEQIVLLSHNVHCFDFRPFY